MYCLFFQVIKWFNTISKRTLLDPLSAHERAVMEASQNPAHPLGSGALVPPGVLPPGVPLKCVDGTLVKQEHVDAAPDKDGGGDAPTVATATAGGPHDDGVDVEDGEIADGEDDAEVGNSLCDASACAAFRVLPQHRQRALVSVKYGQEAAAAHRVVGSGGGGCAMNVLEVCVGVENALVWAMMSLNFLQDGILKHVYPCMIDS